jgi:hypothetical protein
MTLVIVVKRYIMTVNMRMRVLSTVKMQTKFAVGVAAAQQERQELLRVRPMITPTVVRAVQKHCAHIPPPGMSTTQAAPVAMSR